MQGCTATDWTTVYVEEGFDASAVTRVSIEGAVAIGAGCRLTDIGCLRTTEGATYGQGNAISVLDEAGAGNIITYTRLTAQVAALMVGSRDDKALWTRLRNIIAGEVEANCPPCTTIGRGAQISGVRELTNVIVGPECEITGAARLVDCTLASTPEASILVSDGVIIDNCVIQAGSSVTDFARLYDTFVGEACHVGRGFTAENSVFFANSFMDNGEACAALCGPFSVSHHKSTLLIGCQTAFYNAGSATNFSNHAYKLGPVHWGTLGRGTKTASGAHTLLPARIGAFSMLMGKIQTHPDTREMPFSYLIGEGRATRLIPGRNLLTVGTYRDTRKWPQRDRRPHSGRRTLVNYDWLSPFVVNQCIAARQALLSLKEEQGDEAAEYSWHGTLTSRSALNKGVACYDLALRLALHQALTEHEATLPVSAAGVGEWTDLLGMYAPASEIEQVKDDIRSGTLATTADIATRLAAIHAAYPEHKWAWAYRLITQREDLDTVTPADRDRLLSQYASSYDEWTEAIRRDAEREHQLGDVSDDTLREFLDSIGE